MNFEQTHIQAICNCLLRYDPQIVEIVQFGSSVYAPRYARDLDVLVFTRARKDSGYINAADELDLPYDVDVVVQPVDRRLNKSFALGVLGAHKVLRGSGAYLKEAIDMEDATYEEAWTTLEIAREDFAQALSGEQPLKKDRRIRNAFDGLFHASRIASMVYLSIKEGGWGKVKRALPPSYRTEFEEYIDILHVKYFYYGDYPKENVQEEFKHWAEKVRDYVERLEKRTSTDELRPE